MRKMIRKIYHFMQQHYVTFRILVFLKEHGITRRINAILRGMNDKAERNIPTEAMRKSTDFFIENRNRIAGALDLLADEKSKMVWEGVMKYRMYKTPIAPELYTENDQYFVDNIIKISLNEVFVDGGAYTGDTIQQFMDTAKKQRVEYKKIIAYEPDEKNFKLLQRYYGGHQKVMLIKKGLSEKEGILCFRAGGATARIVDDEYDANYKIAVTCIDGVEACKEATWIKMDIEGAEMDALHGAEQTIKRNHPKLTICIYHSDEDMLRIIEYIHDLVPEYKLFVRHHSRSEVETVLYAMPEHEV